MPGDAGAGLDSCSPIGLGAAEFSSAERLTPVLRDRWPPGSNLWKGPSVLQGGRGSLFLYQRPYTQSDLLCLLHTCWQRQSRSPSCLLLVAHWTALPEQQPARTPPAALGPSSRQKVLEQLGLEQRRDTLQWSPGMQGLQAGQLHAESCPAQAPEVGSRLADTPGHGRRELLKAQQGVWAYKRTGWGGVRGDRPRAGPVLQTRLSGSGEGPGF